MNQPTGSVYFNHGKESGPWGSKIVRLAEVAQGRGYAVESLDYAGEIDVTKRVEMLLASPAGQVRPLVLVGSSMGSYVAAVASETLQPQGLFLLAPAFYLPFFPIDEPVPYAGLTAVVHGWRDELIPPENAIRYARKFNAELHLLDGDHRLQEPLETIAAIFDEFLGRIRH